MTRHVALGTLLVAVLGSGAIAGLWGGRWGSSASVRQAAARLEQVPLPLGANWDVQEDALSDREVAVAELDGYLYRHYLHRRSGARVTALLVCGRPGPVSVHTPEVCYAGAGYVQTSAERTHEVEAGPAHQFQVRDFRLGNVATPTMLRVFMTWGYKGQWSVPARPRWAFADKPYLYKLYVIRSLVRPHEPLERDPAVDLIKELMPVLQESLFPGT
jgi:hypothetical protein